MQLGLGSAWLGEERVFGEPTRKKSWKPKLLLLDSNTKARKVLTPPLNTAGPMSTRVATARAAWEHKSSQMYMDVAWGLCVYGQTFELRRILVKIREE